VVYNGRYTKQIRQSIGVTQEALAVACGIDVADVKRLESDRAPSRNGPTSHMLTRLVEGLNVLVRRMNAADPTAAPRRPVELADLHDQDDQDIARFGDRQPWLTVGTDGRVEEV